MNNRTNLFSSVVRHFSPAWYASVMGTGGLANVLFLLGKNMPGLEVLAKGLFILNIALFLILIGPWIARWFLHFDKVVEDLKHSLISNFFATMPIGGLVLGTNFFNMGGRYFSPSFIELIGIILWAYGCVTVLLFSIIVIYNMMYAERVGPELTNYSWFITPVGNIVVPLLGNLLVKAYLPKSLDMARFINLMDIVFYGIGLMLFVIFASILLHRFIGHAMPDRVAAPTFWINLGPIGVGTVSLIGIADMSKEVGLIASADVLKAFALILWGFGLWAFILVVAITIRYMAKGGIPFTLSWWAFIFPLAAYTLSSFNVFVYTKVTAVYWYTILLTILLSLLWLSTFIRSLLGIFSKKLLIPQDNNNATRGKTVKNGKFS